MNNERAPLVMVVDDQEANVSAVGGLLARDGFDVAPCLSGKEALAGIAADPPDLLLLDMRMPGMDGFEVLGALRADEATRDLPVIFLTADHERESLVRAFSSGAVDYVTKPFVPEELLSRVRAHTALKLARDQAQRLARERQESLELIAHDLRNHFTNILFSADMLVSPDDPPARARQLATLREASQSGLMFLQAVLDQAADEARGPVVFEARAEGGTIRVAARAADGTLTLSVADAGRVTVIRRPFGWAGSTEAEPPWSSATWRTMLRPRPLPPARRDLSVR